jgi:hypothetical protein
MEALQYLSELLAIPDGIRAPSAVIAWWEWRRLHYNAVLLLVAVGVALLAKGRREGQGFWAVLLFITLILILPANFWYTFGWLCELALNWLRGAPVQRFAPVALIVGTIFAVLFLFLVSAALFLI